MPVRISSNCRKSAKLTGSIKSSETNEIPETEHLKVLNHCTLKDDQATETHAGAYAVFVFFKRILIIIAKQNSRIICLR